MYLRVCVHFFKRKQNEVSHPHSLLLYSISQNYRRGTLHSLCSLTSQNTLCPGAPIRPPPQKGSWVRRKRRTNKTEEEEEDQAEAGGQAVAKVDTNSGRVDQGNSTTWCLPTLPTRTSSNQKRAVLPMQKSTPIVTENGWAVATN